MGYDPSRRGPLPAGVTTLRLRDRARGDRPVTLEIWYPAADAYRGRDLADATRDRWRAGERELRQDAVRDARGRAGSHPLVVFSHHSFGHRRAATYLCTHLASHGWVVAAPDHAGNTTRDAPWESPAMARRDATELLLELAEKRVADLRFAVDQLVCRPWRDAEPAAARVDAERVAAAGHSFGGFAALALAAGDERVRAVAALAPAGGSTFHEADVLKRDTRLDRSRPVPVLVMAADRDSQMPIEGMRELFARIPEPKRFLVLHDADHQHFVDHVEASHRGILEIMRRSLPSATGEEVLRRAAPAGALCSGERAHAIVRAAVLAWLVAHVRGDARALAWLEARKEAGESRPTRSEPKASEAKR